METQNIFTFIKSSQAVPSFTVHQGTILQQEVSVSASVGPEKLITERDSSRGHWPVVSAPNVDTAPSRIPQCPKPFRKHLLVCRVMITNEGLGTELAWDIYSKLKLKGKIESHEFNFT